MAGGNRDVEADLRAGLAESAKTFVILIRRTLTTPDGAVDGLVSKSLGSPERLRDAVELLGEDDSEARALLVRAVRRAEDPQPPQAPPPMARPDASRFGRPEGKQR
jgi:hypothetical protein